MRFLTMALAAEVVFAALGSGDCEKFEDIYDDGEDLCNTIFSTSFKYVPKTDPNYDRAYTMWWFEDDNPNDLTTSLRKIDGLFPDWNQINNETCHLEGYFHKPSPTPEGDGFTECHPWKSSSCCLDSTVNTPEIINENYGEEWRWDRCGKLSQACERFFVMEACMYECDVNAGLFRRYPSTLSNPENGWELFEMPIKGEFCDAWYTACAKDMFCAQGGGDFFSCAKVPPSGPLSTGAKVAIAFGALASLAVVFTFVLIKKEKDGEPIFRNGAESQPINPKNRVAT